ncbi:MAG: hypothetical protein K0Q77_93 [Anaerosporomusa subterranea]|jgi:exonuclease SbcC|nr:hypothetical protein [Anaerosporomusa subterranea]
MSRLTAIEFKNMKGQTAVQELTGMDIFTGRNGAGKTTRIQALGYAMLGYVPGQKKTATDTFKMSTGDNMSVGLRTESFSHVRALTRSEKRNAKNGETTVTIKESISVSPSAGERTDTDKSIRIGTEIGNFPVMMDFSEFLSMSDAKRRDFIYSLSPIKSDSWNRDRIQDYLTKKLLTDELQVNNPEQFSVMQELIIKVIAEYPIGFGVSEGLQSMLGWLETEKKFWSSKQKDAQGAVRQISELKNDLEETERGIVAKKQELELLQNSLIDIEKQLTAGEEKQKAADKKSARLALLNSEIVNLEELPTHDLAALDTKISEHQGQLVDPPNNDNELATIKTKISDIRVCRKELEDKARGVKSTISTIKTTVATLEEALKKVGELSGRCIAHHMVKCPKDFNDPALVEGVNKNKVAADAKIAELQTEVNGIEGQIKALDDQELDQQNRQALLAKEAQEINQRNASINKSITELTNERNGYVQKNADRDSKLKVYREELVQLQTEPEEIVPDIGPLKERAENCRTAITNLKAVVDQKEKARQALIIVQQSMIDNRKAEYNATCSKLIADTLGAKGVQGELVKEILQPIKVDIGVNLALMGFEYEPFFQTESDTGKEIFQFGWINEKGHYVNFDALSTGQQTVFLAAMMVTIIDRAKPKLRLLVMDNLNHLDKKNFQLLLNGLAEVKDKLDNIILAGAIEFEFSADNWTVWNLGTEAANDVRIA